MASIPNIRIKRIDKISLGIKFKRMKILLVILLVLIIIYVVPFLIYALFSAFAGLKPPEGASPIQFLTSVLISKTGVATAFVLIFYFARGSFGGNWFLYAFLWWVMTVVGEVGQAIGPNYSFKEAVAGIVSETIYFPTAAYVTNWLI